MPFFPIGHPAHACIGCPHDDGRDIGGEIALIDSQIRELEQDLRRWKERKERVTSGGHWDESL